MLCQYDNITYAQHWAAFKFYNRDSSGPAKRDNHEDNYLITKIIAELHGTGVCNEGTGSGHTETSL